MDLRDLRDTHIEAGGSISGVLDDLARHVRDPLPGRLSDRMASGVGFVTFAYDIDGVSMEIAKYAQCLEAIAPGIEIHCIAGNFGDGADAVLDPAWRRHRLDGADGWDKWDGGRWFTQLFYEDLEPGSPRSTGLACEMWRQALDLADALVAYIDHHDIALLVTVNTNSNPGNLAFALAIVLASEATGCAVINNNHDFYWEGGKAGCKRNPGEEPGPRDHFFRNHDNEEFFGFFQRVYPWNGRNWVQANINPLQSRRLIDKFHFRPDDVFTIGTALSPDFFRVRTDEIKRENRRRMTRILGGDSTLDPVSVTTFESQLESWMPDQRPVVCAADPDLQLDITADGALYLLQPTRIVPRKRIWRDWELIGALLRHRPFRDEFERRPDLTLTLHVSGPVPIEHQEAIERVLDGYRKVLVHVPASIGRRLFQAFSVGRQSHPSLDDDMDIVDIFQLADLVLFPSITEGRGLPIPESAAAGVPLVCSPYDPRPVFDEVVGANLSPDEQILYDEFPEGEFPEDLLQQLTTTLLDPASQAARIAHNRVAVSRRFSTDALTASFSSILDRLDRAVKAP
jgi:glycosyltransferase involved in cell wall biosynthesis